jgi:hypothetical protein
MKMKVLLLTTMILLGLATAGAEASGLFGEGAMTPDAGQFVHSRSGSIITTGRLGSLQTTTLPTGAGVGVDEQWQRHKHGVRVERHHSHTTDALNRRALAAFRASSTPRCPANSPLMKPAFDSKRLSILSFPRKREPRQE